MASTRDEATTSESQRREWVEEQMQRSDLLPPMLIPPLGGQTPSTAVVTSIGILDAAACHQRERAKAYDQSSGERSAAAVATAFNAITRRNADRAISESEAWLFLQILKQVRLFSAPGYHADSAEDNVSYGALLAESKARERK